jgi:hypothetical protein
MMLTGHVRTCPCFVTVRVIGRKLWCTIGVCLYLVCLMLYKLVLITFGKVSCMVL